MPSNQEKGGQSRGMHEIHSYETHLRNSKWIVIYFKSFFDEVIPKEFDLVQ